MPDDARRVVLDASVAAKRWFEEPNGAVAREALEKAERLFAPDILIVEMASIAAKRVRRGLEGDEQAKRAVREVASLVDEMEPSIPFAFRAFELARDHGVSVYDGLYLALAEQKGAPLLTADMKLVHKARAAGLGKLVLPLVE